MRRPARLGPTRRSPNRRSGGRGVTAQAAALIDRLGFDTVDAGTPAQSWRFEPESGAYTRIYLADPDVPAERMTQAPAAPVSADKLRAALEGSRRVKVAERAF